MLTRVTSTRDSMKKYIGVFTSLDEPQDVVISENINLPG